MDVTTEAKAPFLFDNLLPELQKHVLDFCDDSSYAKFAQTSIKANLLFESSPRWEKGCTYVYPEKIKPQEKTWKMHFKDLFCDKELKSIFVQTLIGASYKIRYGSEFTGAQLKRLYHHEHEPYMPNKNIAFFLKNTIIQDDTDISSYNFAEGENIQMIRVALSEAMLSKEVSKNTTLEERKKISFGKVC